VKKGAVFGAAGTRSVIVSVIVRPLASAAPVFAAVIVYAIACPDATGSGLDVTAVVMGLVALAASPVALAGIMGAATRPPATTVRASSQAARLLRGVTCRPDDRRRLPPEMNDRMRLPPGMAVTRSRPLGPSRGPSRALSKGHKLLPARHPWLRERQLLAARRFSAGEGLHEFITK